MQQQEKDQPRRPPKIQIVEYHADLLRPDDRIIAYTDDGRRLLLGTAEIDPKYRTYKRLYVDAHMHFFSLTRKGLRQIYDTFGPSHRVARRITRNPKENAWRSTHVLQVLRKHGINPMDYSGKEMDIWFSVMRDLDALVPNHRSIFTTGDYLRRFEEEKMKIENEKFKNQN